MKLSLISVLLMFSLSTAIAFVPSPANKRFSVRISWNEASVSLCAAQPRFRSKFFNQVKQTVQNVLQKHECTANILDLPPAQRESLGVARNLDTRLRAFQRNDNCPRCWLQRAHCVCEQCPPLPEPSLPCNVRRLFLLMHHKEICLAVDTAKMILAAFPERCRLVVGGIGPEYQDSMAQFMDVVQSNRTLVLFPDENAQTFRDLMGGLGDGEAESGDAKWDVIILDGTWSQARKLYARYIPSKLQGGPTTIQLSREAVDALALHQSNAESNPLKNGENVVSGHQLRRHPVKWREVSTLEATRLLLGDMTVDDELSIDRDSRPWDALARYQLVADTAAKRQLGPPRSSCNCS